MNTNLKNIEIIKKIFKIPLIKKKIEMFFYDYNCSIINNRLDLLMNNEYLNKDQINEKLLISAEKNKNINLINYL